MPYRSTSFSRLFFFFFNDPAPTEIYTLSLHDALPISGKLPLGPLEPRLLVVELFLEVVQHLVADSAVAPDAQERLALRPYGLRADAPHERMRAVGLVRQRRGGSQPVAELLANPRAQLRMRRLPRAERVDR